MSRVLRKWPARFLGEGAAVTPFSLTRPFKRGRTFGTILVDVSCHQIIDLLPDRKTKSAAAWMQSHPEIEYVSRDRGNDYAQAARDGAPQARAVADRFHLYKNLVEATEPVVARCYKEIRKDLPKPSLPKLPSVKEWRPARDPAHEHQRQSRLTANQERFDSMLELQKLGIPQGEVARRLGVTKRTVQNWNRQGCAQGTGVAANGEVSSTPMQPTFSKGVRKDAKKARSCIER